MSSAIQKISARAKQIKKASPNKKWNLCIKQASAEYRQAQPGEKKYENFKRLKKAGKLVKHKGIVYRKNDVRVKGKKVKQLSEMKTGKLSPIGWELINLLFHSFRPSEKKGEWKLTISGNIVLITDKEYNDLHKFLHNK